MHKKNLGICVVVAVSLMFGVRAFGMSIVPVIFCTNDPMPICDPGTITQISSSPPIFELVIQASEPSTPTRVLISGFGTDHFGTLIIKDFRNNGYGPDPAVIVTASGVSRVERVEVDTNSGNSESMVRFVIDGSIGSLGSLLVSEWGGASETEGVVDGDVDGPIELVNFYDPDGPNTRRQFDGITIEGDFIGDLLIRGDPTGVWTGGYAMIGVTILGDVGSQSQPVAWEVDGFLDLELGGFHGDLHLPDDPTRGPSVQAFQVRSTSGFTGSGNVADGVVNFGLLQRIGSEPGTIGIDGDLLSDMNVFLNVDDQDVPFSTCGPLLQVCLPPNFCECCFEDWGLIEVDGAIAGQIVIGSNDPLPFPNDRPTLLDGAHVDGGSCPSVPSENPLRWEGVVNAMSETVVIDPIALGTTNYPNTSASIGGGSIGIPPFGLHAIELGLEPGYMSLRLVPLAVRPLRIVHYGPVEWDALVGEPLFIETRLCDELEEWIAVAPTEYSVSYTSGPLRLIDLAFDNPLIAGNEYRIRPVTPTLMPTLMAGYAYLWSTQDGSQDISVQDWEVV